MADTTPSTGSDGQRPQRGPGLVLHSLPPEQRRAALKAGLYAMPSHASDQQQQPASWVELWGRK